MHSLSSGCMAAVVVIVLLLAFQNIGAEAKRTFEVDWANDRFLKDGEPFRFIAGSFHYFRAHPDTWQRKLRTMRAGGLNAVTTYVEWSLHNSKDGAYVWDGIANMERLIKYAIDGAENFYVEWSLHNPKDGVYVWDGIANLERFIKYAIDEDLLVILRPGPYICAERDFGGFPYWLLTKYPNIQLRTSDINYLFEIRIWYSQLMAKIGPYLYGNGGPIIMVQVENEYGSYYACDKKYRAWLRDETLGHVKDKAVLFTNDGPSVLYCGHIDGVVAAMDFGATNNLTNYWNKLRRIQPKGPLVNAEYYPGWLTHWGESMARVNTNSIKNTFIEMLNDGASVNFYMYYGGTNFGFTAGANDGGPGRYMADITSYDYDAPMTEAGDPTSKYFAIREIISRYLPLPKIPIPEPMPKKNYGTIKLQVCCSLLSKAGRQELAAGVVIAEKPKTFEALNQFSGLVLYETYLPTTKKDPGLLQMQGLHDRALIYVENDFVGILSRETPIYDLPIPLRSGKKLQILVENQGRINYGSIIDFKGITGDVTYDKKTLTNWNMTKFPLESYEDIERLIQKEGSKLNEIDSLKIPNDGPTIFYGSFEIKDLHTSDTYLDTTGWSKGIAFVNGENLGRYWPMVGPQVTLYVPAEVLKVGLNKIVLIEYQSASTTAEVTFTDTPNLDGLKN